jgi:1,4-dihydroxy-6-naphthoate synthase
LISRIEVGIRESVRRASADQGLSRDYIRTHAQEIDDRVICSHIDLYVNNFSQDLGEEGRHAVKTFLERGRESGILPDSSRQDSFFEAE